MRILASLILIGIWGLNPLTARAELDTDGDGQTDVQELAAGTDPNNDLSVAWRHLAAWRFPGSLEGSGGQIPLLSSNVAFVPGLDGLAADLTGANSTTFLKFHASEATGLANLSPKRGSIWFYVKPHWFSNESEPDFGGFTDAGVGPGAWATVLEASNFRLRIDPNGTNLVLTSDLSGGGTTTNAIMRISVRSLDFRRSRTAPGEELWYPGLLTYSPEETRIIWVYPGNQVVGTGIAPPSTPVNDRYFSIGTAADGTMPLKGAIDEVITFNAPGRLSTNAWRTSALASNSPPGINLVWVSATNTLVNIKRRLYGADQWEDLGAAIGTNYFDGTAQEGLRYEYNLNTRMSTIFGDEDVRGQTVTGTSKGGAIEDRGKLILLADRTLTNALREELAGYVTNLVGDGWQVLRADMPRHIDDYSTTTSFLTNHFNITNAIAPFVRSNYSQFTTNIRQILIFGHVTIPYSGTLADDGHNSGTAPHQGAWPMDLYYGDVDGIWTDALQNTGSIFPWNLNYPGDGKFDQNFIPKNESGVAEIEMPVCRIDFANMPAFAEGETELLRRYLRKNAAFRRGEAVYPLDAVGFETPILGTFSNIPAETAAEMAGLLGPLKEPLGTDPFSPAVARSLIAAVSGPGGFENLNFSLPTERTTVQIAAGLTSTNIPFYIVRASYSPDWNSANNFLRAILGTPNGGLAVGATYREKNWQIGGLATGHTLGSDVLSVVNNWPFTLTSVRAMELLGDATLRHPAIPPPGPVVWAMTNSSVYLNWSHPAGLAPQYNVYRSTNGMNGPFDRINNLAISTTAFTDLSAPAGALVYMARALGMAETGAGNYTNISQGSFATGIPAFEPGSCCIDDQSANEDTVIGPLSFSVGEAETQSGFQILASSTNTSLIPLSNIVIQGSGASRTVTITPATNQFGTSLITLSIFTDAAVTHRSFVVTVNSVNDAPAFTKGTDRTVGQSSGARTIASWAGGISAGPSNESQQTVSFSVTSDKPFLFSSAPAIDPSGTLTFTPAITARGVASVTVRAVDSGGILNSGQNTSPPQVFTITIGLPEDLDQDGLPDDFESTFGLADLPGANADADSDGDGFSNLQELWAGTHPRNSSSLLEINRTRYDGGVWRFSFSTVQGRGYTIEYNDSFPTGSWQTLFSNFPGFGASVELSDQAGHASRSNRIYRVRVSDGPNSVSSGYAGFWRLPMLANSDSLLSMPFIRPPAAHGLIEAVSASELQIGGAPSWAANQWAYQSGVRSNTYFLLIASGPMEGAYHTITGNSSNVVQLDLEGGTLAGISPGDRVMIVPYWTMGSIFPGGLGIHPSPLAGNRHTEILFPNLVGSGVNLAPSRTLYYLNTWRQVAQGAANKNDEVVLPDMFLWVRHNVATNSEVTAHGIALPTKLRIPLRRQLSAEQDNVVALPRPNAVPLGLSGLFESGAFLPSATAGQRTDEVFVYRAATPLVNRAPEETYYYRNGDWRRVTFGNENMSGAAAFVPGGGVFLRLDPSSNSSVWVNSPNY